MAFVDLEARDKKNYKRLQKLMRVKGNDICCDCRTPQVVKVSVNFGIFLCGQCSTVHMKYFTKQLSRIRPIQGTSWTDIWIKRIKQNGNKKHNKKWESLLSKNQAKELRPEKNTTMFRRQKFLLDKYDEKKYFSATSDPGSDSSSNDQSDAESSSSSEEEKRRRTKKVKKVKKHKKEKKENKQKKMMPKKVKANKQQTKASDDDWGDFESANCASPRVDSAPPASACTDVDFFSNLSIASPPNPTPQAAPSNTSSNSSSKAFDIFGLPPQQQAPSAQISTSSPPCSNSNAFDIFSAPQQQQQQQQGSNPVPQNGNWLAGMTSTSTSGNSKLDIMSLFDSSNPNQLQQQQQQQGQYGFF